MANVNIPLSVSDGVKKIYLRDYDKNVFKVKSKIVRPKKETEIGDIYDIDFKPQIKIKRWMNDANLSVRIAGLPEGEETVFTAGKKIKFRKGYMETRFFLIEGEDDESHKHEMDVVFFEKPSTNVVEFTIASKNLVFYKQLALTQAQIDDGEERPENVVNSYAVYNKTLINDVLIEAKAMHIYRPLITDADGHSIWGDIDIDAETDGQFGTLKITIDQQWLNNAIYPITVDPTFGYTTAGASDYSIRDIIIGNRYSPTYSGSIQKFHIHTGSTSKEHRHVVYDSSANLVDYSASDTSAPSGWHTDDAILNASITAGQNYDLCWWSDSTSIKVSYDTVASLVERRDITVYDGVNPPPDPWSPGTSATGRRYSTYVDYRIEYTYSASLTLGASMTVLVKKIADNANTTITTQAPGRGIFGVAAANMGVSAVKAKKKKKKKLDSEITLIGNFSSRLVKLFQGAITLVGSVAKFPKKVRDDAAITVDPLNSNRWEGHAGASMGTGASPKKKTKKKLKDAEMILTANSDEYKSTSKTINVSLSLGASMAIRINKVFFSDIYITSDQDRIASYSGDLAISLSANKSIRVIKNNHVFIYVATAMGRFISGIVNAVINIASEVIKFIKREDGVTISIEAGREKVIEGEADVNMSLLSDTLAFIDKELGSSVTITGQSNQSGSKIEYLNTEMNLGASATVLIKKTFDSSFTITGDGEPLQGHNFDTQIDLTVSRAIFVKKVNDSFFIIDSNLNRQVFGVAHVSTNLQPDIAKFIKIEFGAALTMTGQVSSGQVDDFDTQMNLGADLLVTIYKSLDVSIDLDAEYIPQEGEDLEVTMSLSPDLVIRVYKALDVDIKLDSEEEQQEGEELEVTMSLNTELTIIVYKFFEAGIDLDAEYIPREGEELEASMSLSPELTIIIYKNLSVDIDLDATYIPQGGQNIEVDITLSPELLITIYKFLDAGIDVDAEYIPREDEELEATMNLSPKLIILINKFLGADINISGGTGGSAVKDLDTQIDLVSELVKFTDKELEAEINLSGETEGGLERDFDTAMGLTAELFILVSKILGSEVILTGSSEQGSQKEEMLEASVSLSVAKSIFVKKNNAVIIQVEGSENKQIEGSALVAITPTASGDTEIKKTLELGASLSVIVEFIPAKTFNTELDVTPEIAKFVSLILESDMTLTGDAGQGEELVLEGAMSLGASTAVEVFKVLDATVSLSGDFSHGKEEEFDVSIGMVPELFIFIKKTNGATITMVGGENKEIEGLAGVTINLGAEATVDEGYILEAGMTLAPSLSIRSYKMLRAELSLNSAFTIENKKKAFDTSVGMTAGLAILVKKVISSDMNISGDSGGGTIITPAVIINIDDERPAKLIGKTFTIREHSQSWYHRPCPK